MNNVFTRRSFLGVGAAALAGCAVPKAAVKAGPEPEFMWGDLLHFGLNIQCDIPVDSWGGKKYFGEDRECNAQNAYVELDKAGFDQVPTPSNWSVDDCVEGTVKFAKEHISPERLKGFLAAPWVKTLPQFERMHEAQIDQMHAAMKLI